jgi:hypothetical protein
MRTSRLSGTEVEFVALCVNLVNLQQMIQKEEHVRTVELMKESLDRGMERYHELSQEIDFVHLLKALS